MALCSPAILIISVNTPCTFNCRVRSSAPGATLTMPATCLNQSTEAGPANVISTSCWRMSLSEETWSILTSRPSRMIATRAQVAQVFDDLRAAQARIKGEFAGQVAHQLLHLCGLFPAVQPADGGAATVRVQQTHQGAHGGGFARPIGSQEAEDFGFLNGEGYVENAPAPAIVFGELISLNDN